MPGVHGDADIATVASAMGHPARGAMLQALLGGRALTATELARVARVAPATASAHLARLTGAGLVEVVSQGRHRYHRLAGPEVAEALESLAAIAPPRPVRGLRESDQRAAERAARSCYDHLAGAAGVALADRLVAVGGLEPTSLALADPGPFAALGVDVGAIGGRRPLTRACLDWSERLPHLAGGLGAAVLDTLLEAGWLARRPAGRALDVTARGRAALRDRVGLELP
jgi:DNA-binding transcriptional ArsR family regulator